MRVDPQQLRVFLLDSGLVGEKDIEAAFKRAMSLHQKPGDVLVSMGKISGEDLGRLEGYILGIPFVTLESEKVDPQVLGIIPEPIARAHNIIAYKKTGRELEVAMLDPEDLATIDFIKKKSNLIIKPRLTNEASMRHLVGLYQKSLEVEFGEIIRGEAELITSKPQEAKEAENLVKIAEELPIIKIVDTLIRHAILQNASDIHIEPLENEVVVRYRIDGILRDAMVLPKRISTALVARVKVLAGLKLDEHRLPQDGRFRIDSPEYKISFRVSVFPIYDGEKVVLRILPENAQGFTLETLGFHGQGLEIIHQNIKRTVGMILATGPTGCGKTTTLYTLLDLLNTPGVNISTIEDPIEYRMPRINQTQVRPEIGFSFANGLRSLLRQDPNIIMVGEIRDSETSGLAVNAALTGHLVLSTLHTSSSAGALPRLLDLGAEPFLIASTVNVIIAQRLVRILYKTKKPYKPSKDELGQLSKIVELERVLGLLQEEKIVPASTTVSDLTFYKAVPSPDAPDGYLGRIGIHEVLVMGPIIRDLLMKNATADQIELEAKRAGMMTMFEDGIFKAVQGLTTIEEVLRVTSE